MHDHGDIKVPETAIQNSEVDLKQLYLDLGQIEYNIKAYTLALQQLNEQKDRIISAINNTLAEKNRS
jgi:hypothetical protein